MTAPLRLALGGLLLAAAASVADEVEPPSNHKAEVRRMVGTYRVVLFEQDGRRLAAAELKNMKVVLGKDGSGTFHVGDEAHSSRFTTFPDKKPKEVDCVYTDGPLKGMTIKGIYKLDKDGMTCCYAEPGKARPTKFETGGGTGLTLYALERVKEK